VPFFFLNFFYSYVHTKIGSLLPPSPTPSFFPQPLPCAFLHLCTCWNPSLMVPCLGHWVASQATTLYCSTLLTPSPQDSPVAPTFSSFQPLLSCPSRSHAYFPSWMLLDRQSGSSTVSMLRAHFSIVCPTCNFLLTHQCIFHFQRTLRS
jgi:hypothetical protein